MAHSRRFLDALSVVLRAGVFGASVALALTASDASAASTSNPPEHGIPDESVSARLRAIRAGVSDIAGVGDGTGRHLKLTVPLWPNWRNGGWGRWGPGWGNGGWHNWNNWRNAWGNGPWGNGGWGNGGNWNNNGWHNFWHNW
jgi:hypothetical protein